MANIGNITEVFKMMEQHLNTENAYLAAEHDVIYLPDVAWSEHEISRLSDLGFHWDDTLESWFCYA